MSHSHLYNIKVPAQKLCLVSDLHILEINLLELFGNTQNDQFKSAFIQSTKRFKYSIYINDTENTVYHGEMQQKDIILPITFSYSNPLPQCFVSYTLIAHNIPCKTKGHFFTRGVHTSTSRVSLQMTPQHNHWNNVDYEAVDDDDDDNDDDNDDNDDDDDDDDDDDGVYGNGEADADAGLVDGGVYGNGGADADADADDDADDGVYGNGEADGDDDDDDNDDNDDNDNDGVYGNGDDDADDGMYGNGEADADAGLVDGGGMVNGGEVDDDDDDEVDDDGVYGNGEADDGEADDGEVDDGEVDDGEVDDGEVDDGEVDDGDRDENNGEMMNAQSNTIVYIDKLLNTADNIPRKTKCRVTR